MFGGVQRLVSRGTARRCCLVLGITAVLLLFGCQKPRTKPVLTKDQMKRIQGSILAERPKPGRFIGAEFGTIAELIGVDIDKKSVAPGGKLKVTWYWKSRVKAKGNWKIFVHLEVPGKRRATYDHHAVEGLYPLEDWTPGQFIRDSQVFELDPRFPTGEAVVYIGIYDERAWKIEKKDIRQPIKSAGTGKANDQSRLEVFRIVVQAKKGEESAKPKNAAQPSDQPIRYRAVRVDTPPVIDGQLEDRIWSQAAWTRYFLRPDGQPLDDKLRTRAKLLFGKDNLYVAFEILDTDIVNGKKARDEALWEEDVVEIYLDPGQDGRDYVEFQFAPTGVLFDAHFSTHRSPEWSLAAKRFNLEGLEAKVSLVGTVNKKDGGDQMWTVEAKIPFKGLPGVNAAPRVGTVWGLNLYRIDSSNPKSVLGMGSLSPVGSDFHDLKNAALLVFGPSLTSGVKRAQDGVPAGSKARELNALLPKNIKGSAARGIKAVFSPKSEK